MNPHDDDLRDDALQALFDDTAPDDPAMLQRLGRKAAQIPAAHPTRSRWWLWLPGLGTAMALAAGVWLVLRPPAPLDGPVASATAPATSTPVAVPNEELSWFDGATAGLWALDDASDQDAELPAVLDDPLAVLDGDEEGDPLGPLELLLDPSDDDLDAYLATYDSMLR